ncbi:unnamed protein product [Coffea canephora]|uniref:DH200=94 genomic scaffold, scaffold_1866 n=1 Tax=Coffea canephora TaxID=49390 RepID=A0A068VJ41_COFCA|nr:unnamed protein product [Coffea canephora]
MKGVISQSKLLLLSAAAFKSLEPTARQAAEREEQKIIIGNQRDYTDQIINGIILVMLTAGTNTSLVTIEWALSLLLNHLEVLEKARAELDAQVGTDRLVDEHGIGVSMPKVKPLEKTCFRN